MSKRRKIVLLAYVLIVLLGTLPYVVKYWCDPSGGLAMDCVAGLLAVPTIPLRFAVLSIGDLVFKMEDKSLDLVMLVVTPIYLACLFWPMPSFAFAPQKCSWPPNGKFSKPYSVVLMIGVSLGACLVLLAEAAPHLLGQSEQAKLTAAETQLANIKTALDAFKADCGRFPSSAEGLTALTTLPVSIPSNLWRGPYLNDVPKDPWGHDYVYRCPGLRGKSGFDIYSRGPDGAGKSVGDNLEDTNHWSPRP